MPPSFSPRRGSLPRALPRAAATEWGLAPLARPELAIVPANPLLVCQYAKMLKVSFRIVTRYRYENGMIGPAERTDTPTSAQNKELPPPMRLLRSWSRISLVARFFH